MHATPEQRVGGRLRALLAQKIPLDEARRKAHEIEGVPLPPEPPPSYSPERDAEIEDLHWKHSCEMRRADAATKRAAILLREVRLLRGVIATLDAEAERLAEQANEPRPMTGVFLIESAKRREQQARELRAIRQG